MPYLCATTALGQLTINSVDCHIDGCWNITNVVELWTGNAARGGNVIMSGSTGKRPYPWRLDESIYTMQMFFSGENDRNGTPYSDPWVGVQLNVEYFRANVIAPPAAPTATVAASLLMPNATTRTANVQPRSLITSGTGTDIVRGVMELVVPSGRFA